MVILNDVPNAATTDGPNFRISKKRRGAGGHCLKETSIAKLFYIKVDQVVYGLKRMILLKSSQNGSFFCAVVSNATER